MFIVLIYDQYSQIYNQVKTIIQGFQVIFCCSSRTNLG